MFPIELLGVETYIYLRSAVHVFTASGIYGVFTVTVIWIVQNSLLSGIAETDLTQLPTYLESSGWSGHKVITIHSQCSTAALFSLATCKI